MYGMLKYNGNPMESSLLKGEARFEKKIKELHKQCQHVVSFVTCPHTTHIASRNLKGWNKSASPKIKKCAVLTAAAFGRDFTEQEEHKSVGWQGDSAVVHKYINSRCYVAVQTMWVVVILCFQGRVSGS
jgi:hypothetical protein